MNPELKNIYNYDFFKMMKKGSSFINTARGEMVVEAHLIKALNEEHLGGAGLDVTFPEPPPIDSPLFSHPKITVCPHIGSSSFRAREQMGIIAVENILAGLKGTPLIHPIAYDD